MLSSAAMETITPIQKAVACASSQAEFARQLGVSQQVVWQWVNGRRPVPAHYCIRIEDVTRGAVSRYQLRPDVFGAPIGAEYPPARRGTAVEGASAEADEAVLTKRVSA